METPVQKSNRPPGDDFRQQRLKAWQPIMTPLKVIILFFIVGIIFVPVGVALLGISDKIYESTINYDGDDANPDCTITTANAGNVCNVEFTFDEDVTGPLHVYYELGTFYQNHRRYVSSVDPIQLLGSNPSESTLDSTCAEKVKNGSLILNPCGLIANSLFTDIISVAGSSVSGANMTEDGIAWPEDKNRFSQPSGFTYQSVSEGTTPAQCVSTYNMPAGSKVYVDSSSDQTYCFYYPNDNTIQYLYESYPDQISPIVGVNDQHFQVWMRPASLPNFRKLYGKINSDFKKGDTLSFTIITNFEVNSFGGSKSIVISTVGEFGGKNPYLGVAYIVVGSLSLVFGLLFSAKQLLAPRPYADPTLLHWD